MLGVRVLGLYWEELARDTAFASDDERLKAWLPAAWEIREWFRLPQHVTPPLRRRLIKSMQRSVLLDEDLCDPTSEPHRVALEEAPFDIAGRRDVPPFPAEHESLLDIYRWYHDGQIHDSRGLHPCRENLDVLLSFAMGYEDDAWRHGVVELALAAWQTPYLLYRMALSMKVGADAAIAGLVANVRSASVGMQILTEIHAVAEYTSGDFDEQQKVGEERKTRIWREAVRLLLGAIHVRMSEHRDWTASALAETLVLSAEAVYRPHLRADLVEVQRAGAEERLGVLLRELTHTRHFVLFPLVHEVHQLLTEAMKKKAGRKPSAPAMPVEEMRILLWLLRVLVAEGDASLLAPTVVADAVLGAYVRELLREHSTDGVKGVSWFDDLPDATSLPWTELAVVLHRQALAYRLTNPDGIDFIRRASDAYRDDQYEGGEVSRAWVRKSRLHIRILMKIHEDVVTQSGDPTFSTIIFTRPCAGTTPAAFHISTWWSTITGASGRSSG